MAWTELELTPGSPHPKYAFEPSFHNPQLGLNPAPDRASVVDHRVILA